MSKEESYKAYKIKSTPFLLQDGGFSSNGIIEYDNGDAVSDIRPHDLQSKHFDNEDDADAYYINSAKNLIDKN